MSPRTAPAPRLSEKAWQKTVTDLLEQLGWSWMHAPTVTVTRKRPAGPITYAETATKGPLGKGWPDLVCVRERVIFVELKADDGRISEDQEAVREALRDAEAEWYLWRPRDFDEAVAVLTRRGA